MSWCAVKMQLIEMVLKSFKMSKIQNMLNEKLGYNTVYYISNFVICVCTSNKEKWLEGNIIQYQ